MDAELTTLAGTVATTLVRAMITDSWTEVKARVVAMWRRYWPERADLAEKALDDTHREVAGRHEDGKPTALVAEGRWQGRLETLLEEHPDAASDLAVLLDELRTKMGGRDAIVTQQIHAGRDAYSAGRDQDIHQRRDS